jgi:hypothetical protein
MPVAYSALVRRKILLMLDVDLYPWKSINLQPLLLKMFAEGNSRPACLHKTGHSGPHKILGQAVYIYTARVEYFIFI